MVFELAKCSLLRLMVSRLAQLRAQPRSWVGAWEQAQAGWQAWAQKRIRLSATPSKGQTQFGCSFKIWRHLCKLYGLRELYALPKTQKFRNLRSVFTWIDKIGRIGLAQNLTGGAQRACLGAYFRAPPVRFHIFILSIHVKQLAIAQQTPRPYPPRW